MKEHSKHMNITQTQMPTVYNSDFDVKSFQNSHCLLESVTWIYIQIACSLFTPHALSIYIYIDISLLRLRGRCHARFTAVVVKLNGGHQSVLPTYTGPLSSDVTQVVQPIPSSFIRTHRNWISFIHISVHFICICLTIVRIMKM
jgi:hypothetical protein